MSADAAGAAQPPQRFDLSGLRPDQVTLLGTVLQSGEVPHVIIGGELFTAVPHAAEVQRALTWVQSGTEYDDDFDDPEYRGSHAPLVKVPRPPLADGRRQATRWRRACGGLFDQVLVTAPVYAMFRLGSPLWLIVPLLFCVVVLPTTTMGWSVGKLIVGTRVTDALTLRSPGLLTATARWLVGSSALLLTMTADLNDAVLTPVWLAIYAPIVVTVRGLHDYVAGTIVVESSDRGPGGWLSGR